MESVNKDFLEIISRYQGIIHKVNLVYFISDADKRDNFQEVIYQLWKSFPVLKTKDKPASWIYTVAINTAISKIRKDRKLVFLDAVPDVAYEDMTTRIEQSMNYQNLLVAVQKLNEIDRSIILLYMEDYSYDEIAEITGMTASNTGVKIHRIKSQLKNLLKG